MKSLMAAAVLCGLLVACPDRTSSAPPANSPTAPAPLPTALLALPPGHTPNLVSLDPANFARDLPAGARELVVTFDRAMDPATWSWQPDKPDSAPAVIGEPEFAPDGHSVRLRVELAVGRNYAVWLNTLDRALFRDTSGAALPPLRWVFSTVGAPVDPGASARQIGPAPRVVATRPASGARDVDPKLDRLTVTFDRKMDREGWSWVKEPDTNFPETAGEPSFDAAGTTNTLPVKLKPATTYTIWCNSDQFTMFSDEKGQPALPYRWTFTTKK